MTAVAPLEMEDANANDEQISGRSTATQQLRQQPPFSNSIAVYLSMIIACFLLVLFSPGTRLWDRPGTLESELESQVEDVATLNAECLAEAVGAVIAVFFTLCLVRGSDPGYLNEEIMRRACALDGEGIMGEHQNDGIDDEVIGENTEDASPNSTQRSLSYNTNGMYRGRRRKLCSTCGFAPPLRSHHCRACDRCVATFDHHCLFLGTCIGERNHCRFWWFLTANVLALHIGCSIVGSSHLGFSSIGKWSQGNQREEEHELIGIIIVIASKVYLYSINFAVSIMWIIHTAFAVSNTTTFECGKGPRHIDYLEGSRVNDFPFSNGLNSNLLTFCCFRDGIVSRLLLCNDSLGIRGQGEGWTPILWRMPERIVRDSEDCFAHPWENKYWSCC